MLQEFLNKYSIDFKDYLKYSHNQKNNYKIYYIKQKTKSRIIQEPNLCLKNYHKNLIPFFEEAKIFDFITCKKGSSILENANYHKEAKYFLKVDIQKCYPSTNINHIINGLFLVSPNKDWLNKALMILPICLINKGKDLVLSTGSPLSPILCNIALAPLDEFCQKEASKNNYLYTRYLDDLCFSTKKNKRDWNLINIVCDFIKNYDYKPNYKKTKWLTNNDSDNVIITGVRVGKGAGVPREYRRILRVKLDKYAKTGQILNEELKGSLSYLYSIDKNQYHKFLTYYQKRKSFYESTLQDGPSIK